MPKWNAFRAALVASGLAAGSAASAADLPTDAYYQNTVSPAVYNWAGAYVGANLGYGWSDANVTDPHGWLGGIQAGFNAQAVQFVYGVEGDIGLAGVSDRAGGVEVSIDSLNSLRGRAGIAIDQFLLYGTGGFSFAKISADDGIVSDDAWEFGWVAGVGAEAFLTKNWTARIEAFYYDLGRNTFNAGGGITVDPTVTVLRAGVNYHF